MGKWITICAICLAALFFTGAELHCWDTAGTRTGAWSETSYDGLIDSGRWTGYVASDCR